MTNSDTGKTTHDRYHRIKRLKSTHSSWNQLLVRWEVNRCTRAIYTPHTIHPISSSKGYSQDLNHTRNARQAWGRSVTHSPERDVSHTRHNTVKISFTHSPCRQKINTGWGFATAFGLWEAQWVIQWPLKYCFSLAERFCGFFCMLNENCQNFI